MLAELKRVTAMVPPEYEPLMIPHLARLHRIIEPGVTTLNWTSMNIETYIESVYDVLSNLELILNRAKVKIKQLFVPFLSFCEKKKL